MEPGNASVYHIVEQLYNCRDKMSKDEIFRRNLAEPNFARATRIHRHLKSLEQELTDEASKAAVSLKMDRGSNKVIISINHNNIRCNRVAYLTSKEYSLLRKNREVRNALKRCTSSNHVA